MGVTTTKTNKPFNPRGNDQSPLAYNKAAIYSGKALDFDGVNDYVDLDGFTMAGTNATFIFTAKWNSISGLNYIFDLDPQRLVLGSQLGTEISIYDNVSWKKFADWDDTTNTNGYALTIEGTTAKLYLNGQPFGNTLTLGTTIDLSATTEFSIGSSQTKLASYFNGQISGTKLFNTALTPAQVADLYNNPEKICPTGVDNTALKLWLPMQEGAGTTAYDGSGNGNHGTISGATYVHGIGAPVAQTAVIDWNKGENIQINSEDFTQSNWLKEDLSVTANATTAPDGSNTATKIVANTTNIDHTIYDPTPIDDYVHSIFAKAGEYDYIFLGGNNNAASDGVFFDLVNGTINQNTSTLSATIEAVSGAEGWYRCSVIGNIRYNIICLSENGTSLVFAGNNSSGIYIWGASLIIGTTKGPYVRTGATTQPSPVLLPQGLTTGRDITGVNLFENVRKQGALNLDGKSWAEVHDNESLDFGSGSFSLEAWVRANYLNQGSAFNAILGLGGNASEAGRTFIYYNGTFDIAAFGYDNNASTSLAQTIGTWIHIVGTYDETNATLYINGLQVDQDARTAVDITNALVKQIGRDATSVRYYNDQIAQPRIYNRALTAEEVQRNYDAGKNTYTN